MDTLIICAVGWLIAAIAAGLFIAPRLYTAAQALPEVEEDDHARHG